MKIALINTLYYPHNIGGAEKSVQLLAEGLLQAGHDVFVITLDKPGELLRQDMVNGVRVYRVPLRNIYWPFDDLKKKPHVAFRAIWHYLDRYNGKMKSMIYEILRSEQPSIVHTHNLVGFSVSAWDAAKSLGLPLLHTMRDYSLICPKGMYKKGQNCPVPCKVCSMFSRIKRAFSKKVDLAVGISRFTLNKHVEHGFFPVSKHDFIYNPVPMVYKKLVNGLRMESNFCIGYLGRLAPNKGVEDIIDAVEELKGEIPIRFFIAGSGKTEYEQTLRKRAEGLPVEFLGYVKPEELFRLIHCLVVSSRWHEPFGRVIIETFACAIPVIASNRGGIPEIVDEGQTGWLYDPDIPGDLKRALIKAYTNRRGIAEMGQRAREKVQDFTVEKHVQRYLNWYENLTDRSKK